MTDLTGFLLARIAEDQAPKPRDGAHEDWCMDRSRLDGDDGPCAYCGHPVDPAMVEWVQPSARVLAECEAKRRIVGKHGSYGGGSCSECYSRIGAAYPCDTLRLLALPYADHELYREEWKP